MPTLVASWKRRFNQILVINLFLGRTLIGWVVALVMALEKEEKKIENNNKTESKPSDDLEKLERLSNLYKEGTLTKEEFDKKKRDLLEM